MKVTVDTNVLVRAVLGDHPTQSPAAARALRAASLIAVTDAVLCEFVWVLRRGYKRQPQDITGAISRLLATDTVVADRPAVAAGIAFLEAGGDFADGVIAHQGSQGGAEIFLSFDRTACKLARQQGLEAMVPGAAALS